MLISIKYWTAESYLLNRGSYLLNTENYHQIMTKASEKHLQFQIEGAHNDYIKFSSNRIAR